MLCMLLVAQVEWLRQVRCSDGGGGACGTAVNGFGLRGCGGDGGVM